MFTCVPATGLCDMTLPIWLQVGSTTFVTVPRTSPAARNAVPAVATVSPVRLGTSVVGMTARVWWG